MRPRTTYAITATVHIMEQIQRRYASGAGADEFVVEMLADLRHFCDSHALPFAKLDERAVACYLTERSVRDGVKGTPSRDRSFALGTPEHVGNGVVE